MSNTVRFLILTGFLLAALLLITFSLTEEEYFLHKLKTIDRIHGELLLIAAATQLHSQGVEAQPDEAPPSLQALAKRIAILPSFALLRLQDPGSGDDGMISPGSIPIRDAQGRLSAWLSLASSAEAEKAGLAVTSYFRVLFFLLGAGLFLLLLYIVFRPASGRTSGENPYPPSLGEGRAEGKVEEILTFLAQAQEKKLEAVGTLAAGVAHELNQPLNALQLNASGMHLKLMQGKSIGEEELRSRLEAIIVQAERISAIITHMRQLVRQEGGQPLSAISIPEAVASTLRLTGEQMQSCGIQLVLSWPEDLPMVRVHPMQFEQVLINLLVNAQQAFDRSSQAGARRILLSAVLEGRRVVLSLSDNGPGLGEDADKVFDPFFSGQTAGRGMGVGLSLVYTFVRSWGGSVQAGEGPEGGACFTLKLVRAEEEPAPGLSS